MRGGGRAEDERGDGILIRFGRRQLDDEPGRLLALRRYGIIDTAPEDEFNDIVRLVRQVFDLPMASISLIDEARQWFKAGIGLPVTETPRSVSFCDHTIRDAVPMVVEDTMRDPRFAENPYVTGAPGLRCYMGAPLTTPDGYNIGSLCVMGTEPRAFTPSEQAVLRDFARIVVVQMELRMSARQDSLTGTLSRGGFEGALENAFENYARDARPVTLGIVDIDHFKAVNDRFGHPQGDQVLRAASDRMGGILRRIDVLGRLGGEEFGILLPGVAVEDAVAVAERVRQSVAALALPQLGGWRVTVSIGLAQLAAGMTVEQWVAAADAALYDAKNSGRNRVVVAASQVESLR